MAEPGNVRLTRRYRFSATHRLYTEALSDHMNREIYGKCANDNGHGHNYQLFVTVKAPIDLVTGMCCNLDDLDYYETCPRGYPPGVREFRERLYAHHRRIGLPLD